MIIIRAEFYVTYIRVHYKMKYYILMCWACVNFRAKLHYITNIHYKARLYLHMCWVCVTFRTKFYSGIHFTSHSFHIAISFSVLASPIQHVSGKLLELHHDYREKTVH